jgi:hypothetical protein
MKCGIVAESARVLIDKNLNRKMMGKRPLKMDIKLK